MTDELDTSIGDEWTPKVQLIRELHRYATSSSSDDYEGQNKRPDEGIHDFGCEVMRNV